MGKYASAVVAKIISWKGKTESNGGHKQIIDIYNSHIPRARGYKVKYTDEWCAACVSAVAIDLGYTNIIPIECSCGQMINKAKDMGIWVEDENRKPNVGDIVLYDWNDSGKGDNKGWADHVGIVTSVKGDKFIVTEGNYKQGVNDRELTVNAKLLRGFIVPKYDSEPTSEKVTNTSKSISEVAKEVINGKWGNGLDRRNNLEKAGYDYLTVQTEVNKLLKSNTLKPISEVAKEVINGKWGNSPTRKKKLTEAGYNYETVQKEVNRLLK